MTIAHDRHAPCDTAVFDALEPPRSAGSDAALVAQLRTELNNARNEIHNLEQALSSSRLIGAAVGIVMATHKIAEPQAFAMLRYLSQNSNRKVREIAERVVETGALPDFLGTSPDS